jgi:cbb3-type cytochrome oxidase subunit 1
VRIGTIASIPYAEKYLKITYTQRFTLSENRYIAKFYLASVIFFFVGSFQGGLQQLYLQQLSAMPPEVGDLIVGMHVHLNLLGWVSLALIGTIYLVLPMVTGKPIYSVRLANVGFWFYAVFEVLVYISGMAMALTGIMQLGLALDIFTPLLGVGVWIFIANVILSITKK